MTSFTFTTTKNNFFLYNVVVDHLKISVVITDPGSGDISDFEKVSTGNGKIIFCDSNGHVTIEASKSGVSFSVGKSGAGGDGYITITLPFEICQEALVQSLDARRLCKDNDSDLDSEED